MSTNYYGPAGCSCGNEWPCPDDRDEWCICGYGGYSVALGDTHTFRCSDQWRRLAEERAYASRCGHLDPDACGCDRRRHVRIHPIRPKRQN